MHEHPATGRFNGDWLSSLGTDDRINSLSSSDGARRPMVALVSPRNIGAAAKSVRGTKPVHYG